MLINLETQNTDPRLYLLWYSQYTTDDLLMPRAVTTMIAV